MRFRNGRLVCPFLSGGASIRSLSTVRRWRFAGGIHLLNLDGFPISCEQREKRTDGTYPEPSAFSYTVKLVSTSRKASNLDEASREFSRVRDKKHCLRNDLFAMVTPRRGYLQDLAVSRKSLGNIPDDTVDNIGNRIRVLSVVSIGQWPGEEIRFPIWWKNFLRHSREKLVE